MPKYIKTVLTFFLAVYIVIQSACFLFLAPQIASADVPSVKNPFDTLQVKIPGMQKFSEPHACPDDPNKICVNWISEYIAGIYKYAIGIVGILATVVMMFGGFLYLTAAGESSRVSEAQEWIKASLTGLIIALSSYMILYQVNPELVKLKSIGLKLPTAPAAAPAGEDTCQKYNSDGIINFLTTESTPLPSSFNSLSPDIQQAFTDAANAQSVNVKLLKAIAAQESRFNPSAVSNAGACGIMQLLPSTAKFFDTNAVDCQWLKDHPKESILIAAKYIASSGRKGNIIEAAAGYNSGYGMIGRDGKIGAFGDSQDCPGVYAYQCCINPGGLTQTQDYVFQVEKFYNGQ